jgi:membrane protease YdiL (CAAX protease family)
MDGPNGLRQLFARWRSWRAGGRWYAAFFLTPLVLVAVLGPLMLLSDGFTLGVMDEDGGIRLFVLGVSYALLGPAFEETGWAGFAQPRLLERRSMLTAGLLLGVIHAIWHLLPDYWGSIDFYGAWYALHFLAWIVSVTALRVLMVRAWAGMASLPVAFLIHGSFTGGWMILGPLDASAAQAGAWQALFAACLSIAVLVVVLRTTGVPRRTSAALGSVRLWPKGA